MEIGLVLKGIMAAVAAVQEALARGETTVPLETINKSFSDVNDAIQADNPEAPDPQD